MLNVMAPAAQPRGICNSNAINAMELMSLCSNKWPIVRPTPIAHTVLIIRTRKKFNLLHVFFVLLLLSSYTSFLLLNETTGFWAPDLSANEYLHAEVTRPFKTYQLYTSILNPLQRCAQTPLAIQFVSFFVINHCSYA